MTNREDIIQDPTDFEISLLQEALLQQYGYDFRDYAAASFRRRILNIASKHRCDSIAGLRQRILEEENFFTSIFSDLTVTVTDMFRDPAVYKTIREQVVPYLKTYPRFKVWCAGCSGGEEVYSLAIIFQEEGILDRAFFYGTDINPAALAEARSGIISLESVKTATANYFKTGGRSSFSKYFTICHDAALLNKGLLDRMLFSDHNLVCDGVFGEMQLILCRNVMIYFNKDLQERVLSLLASGLSRSGFLCLGTKESLSHSRHHLDFVDFARQERVYRKKAENG